MKKKKILIVDDEPLINDFLYETLTRKEYQVEKASDGTTAVNKLHSDTFDLVITDIRLPDISGMDILKEVKAQDSNLGVIMITAFGTIENAVEAMKVGAYHYITKPFSADEIEVLVDKYFNYQRLVDENQYLKKELNKKYYAEKIIGKSPKILEVLETVKMVAKSKVTVLIYGPTGTGKELVAKAIHYNSDRKDRPFVKVNCAALPEGLVESELFGHEKGAFTGAIRRTKGRFEIADGGTLLLDEISEISSSIQAKLLRVLQEEEFEKVGNPATVHVDVRIIATTNKDLREEVKKGTFREDLFYRLNVVPVVLPPLKERKEDIPLLVDHFVKMYAEKNNKLIEGISDQAIQKLMEYDWPGNIRELENCVERAVVITQEKTLGIEHFFFGESKSFFSYDINLPPTPKTLEELERYMILKTLKEQKGNRTRTAKILGISVRTLRNKLHEYKAIDYFDIEDVL